MPWSVLQYVTSGLTLLALIVVATAVVQRVRLARDLAALREVPPADRAGLIAVLAERYPLPTDKLRAPEVAAIIMRQIEQRERQNGRALMLFGFLGLLFAGLTYAGLPHEDSSNARAKWACPPTLMKVTRARTDSIRSLLLQVEDLVQWLQQVDERVVSDTLTFYELQDRTLAYSNSFVTLLAGHTSYRRALEVVPDGGAMREAYDRSWNEVWRDLHVPLFFDADAASMNKMAPQLYGAVMCQPVDSSCRAARAVFMQEMNTWRERVLSQLPQAASALEELIAATRDACGIEATISHPQ